jgi:hypothetical protein
MAPPHSTGVRMGDLKTIDERDFDEGVRIDTRTCSRCRAVAKTAEVYENDRGFSLRLCAPCLGVLADMIDTGGR